MTGQKTAETTETALPPLIWMDLEMSGLDPERCQILEIASIVTDGDLNVIAQGPDLVVHQPDSVLEAMDAWCTEHHGKSGLTAAVRASTLSLEEAENETLAFLQRYCPAGKCPLAGNSVWQDRRFIDAYLPRLGSFLHYRTVDVSTLKELVRRWYPEVSAPKKTETHRALDDIRESIEELLFYRKTVLR